ncbi:hypothetical protein vseg_005909 [Gypsophila vaccaria]
MGPHPPTESTRSPFPIDLNQIPSPPEPPSLLLSPTSLVRSFHDNPPPPTTPAASLPAADGPCGRCGAVLGHASFDRLVCDACERGFHFVCAGGAVELTEEWLCVDCVGGGVESRRWRLGRTTAKEEVDVRLIDVNVSPPFDAGDSDPNAADSRKLWFHNNSYSGYAYSGALLHSNSFSSGSRFGPQKASSIGKHAVRLDFQDVSSNSWSTGRSYEDVGHGPQLGRSRSSNTAFRVPSLNPGEVLQSLREFVFERHGVLGEGWRVEFRQSKKGYETYAVYCAPDGKIFETMSDVANYLGVASSNNTMEPDLRNEDGSALRRNGLHLPKRRKLTKLPTGNEFMESKDILTGRFNNGCSTHPENEHFSLGKYKKNSVLIETVQQEAPDIHQFHEGLPLQYEDFFVLSLGKVDARASYHDTGQISPVGYRSCWHDKVTGSLFLCHVLDGGDSVPVYKVKRFSCSALPVPYGTTILQRRSCMESNVLHEEEGDKSTSSDEECCVEMILSDPCFPAQGDFWSWLLNTPIEDDGQKSSHLNFDSHSPVGEKIGEFSVDGNSSSQVWTIVSQKLVDACCQIYKQSGSLTFFCKHANEGISSFCDIANDKKDTFSSLHKFCSLLGSLKVPPAVKSDDDLLPTIDALKQWLDSDRFGLDVDFVQELIEQCPDVKRCPRYESLKRRNDHLNAPMVQNGLLLINGRSIDQCQQNTVIDSLYKKYRNDQELARVIHNRPLGKHFGGELPPYLVGDVLQVWGLIMRFGEILNLEPPNFCDLEAELISPWFENFSLLGSCEGGLSDGEATDADGQSLCVEQTRSSSCEKIAQAEESRCVEIQTAAIKGDADAKINLSTTSKCTVLRRAHISLLDVLVSELQIKVAAMVDPSIDGESKSRRGRRKDVDSSILAIRPKLNLLPINELTWMELARRYVLAVVSMDGNLDSAETGIRECGKVFRCLQGDGGVLCGSLVGVAGIEADAVLLAEATKRIFGCLISEDVQLTLEDDNPESNITSGLNGGGDGSIPEWAQVLEPVKKLPTNVGTRIRKCVYEALEKDPPDWARTKLERSISKEVYKGNASGPTKKAVLAVLADVHSEASQQKIALERKKKSITSRADIVMRQCRILLRRAASADTDKMFCNLLGRNLVSTENDDDGLLGSPAMVSRPLDFRTIDLRLAVGVYNGSHQAFLEDVRELWKNISIAHSDQPDLVQLAETLFKNFESLYQDEVIALDDKLKEYFNMEQITPEAKKEIFDIHASTKHIPKAPWDEGVCKVCGVDKDDDSVLLCDTCDAEYHTYCLNPPLARIPDGNWYCPACVSRLRLTSKGVHIIGRQRRRNHGDGVRNYLDELARLSTVMQEKDCWEFSVDERISLLKFLCDEVLNSIVIRQHLEQCFETSADLQQKLRTLYSEWKSAKLREEILATKIAKLAPVVTDFSGDVSAEGQVGIMATHSSCEELQPALCSAPQATEANNHFEKNVSSNSQVMPPTDSEWQVEYSGQAAKEDTVSVVNHDCLEPSSKRQKSIVTQESSPTNPLLNESSGKDDEFSCLGKVHERGELDVSALCKSEGDVTASCDLLKAEATEGISCSTSNELQAFRDDLKVVRSELSVFQQSVASAEAQLLKSSTRMEYLGTDSSRRLYWASAQEGEHPLVIVDCTMALEPRKKGVGRASMMNECLLSSGPTWSVSYGYPSLGGSTAACPFVYGSGCSSPPCSQWVYYQSEAEVRELVKSLNDYDPKERELKDSIRHSQKLRFHELHQSGKQDQVPPEESMNAKTAEVINLPATKATAVLECTYGPFSQGETMEVKKRQKRSRGTNDGLLHRCKCLEPVWFSRHHCFSCHKTFCTVDELDAHSDGKCQSGPPISGEEKANVKSIVISNGIKSDKQQRPMVATDKAQADTSAGSKQSRLVESQIKGLIGTDGALSFVPSTSSCLSDSTLMLKKGTAAALDQIKSPAKAIGQSGRNAGKGCNNAVDMRARRLSQIKHENSERGQLMSGTQERRKKYSSSTLASPPMSVDAYCTVPQSSLKPVSGIAAYILRQLKICLLDMEAALPEEGFRLLKADHCKRRAWRDFVKAATTIFEMVQATIVLEDMIKTDHLKNEWWYWSSLSAAVKTSTLSALALRVFALDNAIVYDRTASVLTRTGSLKSVDDLDQQSPSTMESSDKSKQGRRSSRRKRDADG